jgi:uncharacterized protein YlxP (DUF503 family)
MSAAIGLLAVELHIPDSHSLKAKRQVLSRIKARLRNRYNVSVAELDYQDKWQRTMLGIVGIASSQQVVEKTLNEIERELEGRLFPGTVLSSDISYLAM